MIFRLPIFQIVSIVVLVNGDNPVANAVLRSSRPLSRRAALSVTPDRMLSEVNVNSEAESGSKKVALKEWEDDDDDDPYNSSVLPASDGDKSLNQEVLVEEGKATEPTAEWPDDDDTTAQIQSPVNENYAGTTPEESSHEKKSPNITNTLKENTISKGNNEEENRVQVSLEKGENVSEWADDDDDGSSFTTVGDGLVEKSIKPVAEWPDEDDEVQGNTAVGGPSGSNGSEEEGITLVGQWPDDDDEVEGNMAVGVAVGASNNEKKFVGNEIMQEGQSTTTNELGSTKTIANEDNLILSHSSDASTFNLGAFSATHRNQSKEGEDEAVVGGYEETAVGTENGGELSQQDNIENDVGAENNGIVQDALDLETRGDGTPSGGNVDNNPAGNQHYLPIDGSSSTQSIIPGNNGNELPGFYEIEDDSFTSNTFSVLLMAAIITSVLVFRKRVLDRVHANSSLGTPNAIKDELVDVVMRLFDLATRLFGWAKNRMRKGDNSGEGRNASSSSADNRTASGGNSGPIGSETIPLSTATDEEWGWEDDDVIGGNLELSGIAGRDSEEKENDDLAMAIAISLSETEKNVVEEAKGEVPSVMPQNKFTANKSSSTFSSTKDKRKIQRAPVMPKQESTPETPSQTPSSSIEDLLGQMGGTGGPVITSFGKKPKSTLNQKSAPKKKESSSDDIFASMGLSQSLTNQKSAPKKKESSSNDMFAQTTTQNAPPKNSSLVAEAWDDDDIDADSWGDDGDLDDLLDV